MDAAGPPRPQGFWDTLYQVERPHMPFPDNPPTRLSRSEYWQDLTNRREKYAQIDFAKTGSAEQRILDELRSAKQRSTSWTNRSPMR